MCHAHPNTQIQRSVAPEPSLRYLRVDEGSRLFRDYIRGAYGSYGFGRNPNVRPPKILGGPDWVDTDRYDIVAKAPGETGLDEMYGPMLRALLEDRFGLKIHSEIRELPVYALTAAGGGAKLTRLPSITSIASVAVVSLNFFPVNTTVLRRGNPACHHMTSTVLRGECLRPPRGREDLGMQPQ